MQVEATSSSSASLRADLPLAGLSIQRQVHLRRVTPQAALVQVTDVVANVKVLGRIFNMVQHPSIAAPFLSVDTVVTCNGGRGFRQAERGSKEMVWQAPGTFPLVEGKDLRGMTGGADDVFSFEVDPKEAYGWAAWRHLGGSKGL